MTALRESGPLTRNRISGDATDMTEQERDILLLSLGRASSKLDGQGKLEDGQARLEAGQGKLEDGQGKLEAGQGKLEAGQARLEAGHNVLAHRMDQLEASITEVLRDGLAKVLAAVERFADTKADQSDVDQLRADVDELQRAAGE